MAHVFESGIRATPNHGGLDGLVRRQLDLFRQERAEQAREGGGRFVPPGTAPYHIPPPSLAPGPAQAPGPVPASAHGLVSTPASAPAIKSEDPPEGPATPVTLAPVSPEDPEKPEITPGPFAGPARRHAPSNTIMSETGEYLVRVASTYARLTTNLVSGAHLEGAVYEAHEQSRLSTRFTDMSILVAMDLEQSRLR